MSCARRSPAVLGQVQSVRYGPDEPSQVIFGQVVVGAEAGDLGCLLLAYRSRDEDEWNIRPTFLQEHERAPAVEARQLVVRDDDIGRSIERGDVVRFGLDACPCDVTVGFLELHAHKVRILRTILDMQHSQWRVHRLRTLDGRTQSAAEGCGFLSPSGEIRRPAISDSASRARRRPAGSRA
jgi:hypothetical protein